MGLVKLGKFVISLQFWGVKKLLIECGVAKVRHNLSKCPKFDIFQFKEASPIINFIIITTSEMILIIIQTCPEEESLHGNPLSSPVINC